MSKGTDGKPSADATAEKSQPKDATAETAEPEAQADPQPEQKPLLRVINSDASPEEVAAIVAVFSALGGGEAPARKPRPTWNHPERLVRATHAHGPGGWRASSLPR